MTFLKKLIICVCMYTFFVVLFSVTIYADTLGQVSISEAQITDSAEDDSVVVKTASKGEVFKVLDSDGELFKIQVGTAAMYIRCDNLSILGTDAVVSGTNVNVRKDASLTAQISDRVGNGTKVEVSSFSGEFFFVTYGNKTGYIHRDLLTGPMLRFILDRNGNAQAVSAAPLKSSEQAAQEKKYAFVNAATGLNLRISASTDSDSVCVVPYGTVIEVIGTEGDWSKVLYGTTAGYMKSEFLTSKEAASASDLTLASTIIEFAKQFQGTPYKWAGTDLRKGVDCSGFVYAVFKNFGISLNRTSRDMVNNGTRISKSELMPGDLVFFDTSGPNNGAISHVGIYIGNGNFIHAASASRNPYVIINSLSEDYYTRTYVTACRILN